MESALTESSLYILLLVFAAGCYADVFPRQLEILSYALTAYLLIIVAWSLFRFPWRTSKLRLWRIYRGAVKYGVGIAIASIANVGLVSLGRVLIGIIGTFEEVGVYSLVYRLSAPLVAIHQFLATFRFTKLYGESVKSFELHFARLSLLLFVGAIITAFFGPRISHHLVGLSESMPEGSTGVFILMTLVMILWSQLSLMELFVARERRSLLQLPGFIAGSVVMILCLFLPIWKDVDQIANIALLQGLGLAIAVVWQFTCSGVPIPRWPIARSLVLIEVAALVLSWILIAMKVL
jgi:O-antigen/teichoic acid export membrane protein